MGVTILYDQYIYFFGGDNNGMEILLSYISLGKAHVSITRLLVEVCLNLFVQLMLGVFIMYSSVRLFSCIANGLMQTFTFYKRLVLVLPIYLFGKINGVTISDYHMATTTLRV